MKFWSALVLIAVLSSLSLAYAFDCPFCSGKAVSYCNVDITPEERVYNEEVTINITIGFQRSFEPIEPNTKVEIQYYNKDREIAEKEFRTDSTGIIKFTPEMVGYHLVKTCGKGILIYVNSTCGDGVCGGGETRNTCTQDCGDCGDGICDINEDEECPDCAVCGDSYCSAGETRKNCLKDCVFCGDEICDYIENRESCSDDCASGAPDEYCDGEKDDICDPDCTRSKDPDCAPKIKENYSNTLYDTKPTPRPTDNDDLLLIVGLAIAVLIAVVVIGVATKLRRRGKKEDKAEVTKKSKQTKKAKQTKKKSAKVKKVEEIQSNEESI